MTLNQLLTRFIAGCLAGTLLIVTPAWTQDSAEAEKKHLATLRSDAPPSEKALACKSLAVHGSSEAVADLAKLLPDPQLSSWARIALEAIPGDASDQALRSAAESLDGRLRVGMINSIGVRRDVAAVELLIQLLEDSDADAASAAAIALGRIGNEPATKSLRQALAKVPDNVRSAVAEGCVLCAEGLHAEGDSERAAAIYDAVRTADVPLQRIIEATRGAILARQEAGIELLMATFRSPDKKLFQLALGTIREFPGDKLDPVLAAELANAEVSRAALLVQAMADRSETVDLATILKAAEEGDKRVRLSAMDALRRIGNASCLAVLLNSANEEDDELAAAAMKTLAGLSGEEVDQQIVSRLDAAKGTNQPLLLRLVGLRRIDAFELVTRALDHSDPDVRKSALFALGETVDLDGLSVLISQVTNPGRSAEAADAQRALKVACIRMPEPDKCTEKLVAAMNEAPDSKSVILEIVGAVGGSTALSTLASAAKSDDPVKQDIASRLLGKWNNTDAAPVLLDLAQTAPAEKYQIRALRGYIGIARKFPMQEKVRVAMCQKAWDASKRLAEKQLILDVLKIHPSRPALKLASKAQQIAELKDQASDTIRAIESKVGAN